MHPAVVECSSTDNTATARCCLYYALSISLTLSASFILQPMCSAVVCELQQRLTAGGSTDSTLYCAVPSVLSTVCAAGFREHGRVNISSVPDHISRALGWQSKTWSIVCSAPGLFDIAFMRASEMTKTGTNISSPGERCQSRHAANEECEKTTREKYETRSSRFQNHLSAEKAHIVNYLSWRSFIPGVL